MIKKYPSISTDCNTDVEYTEHYVKATQRIIGHVLPPNFFEGEDAISRLHEQLPIVCWTPLGDPPFNLSFFLFCSFRPNAFRFFHDMITRWLIPGQRMNALVQFAIDFSMTNLSSEKYIGGEIMVRIETQRELEMLQKNLPIIESEIRLGIESYYQASRILEIKGLSSDEKTAFIQENIVSLVKQRPQDFDYDILSEMQHLLVVCKDGFKAARNFRHLSRIICVHYLFRKTLRLSLEAYPNRRYISVKLIRAHINQKKRVLGVALGISFVRDNEMFEARHILSGIEALVPGVKVVEGSFVRNQGKSDPISTLYLEIEKENGESITLEEERLLKDKLAADLKNRIEERLNPIFMPQNEEEVMRHIVTLSHQLKFVRDLPQVIINFTQQTEEKLEFLVIVLRVHRPNLPAIESYFSSKSSFLQFIPDRTKTVGTLRKKYKKQASVFRLRIKKAPFLRKNHAVDLYKARQQITVELARLIGDFRDFNGGTISKETELFSQVRKELGKLAKEHAFLLENYFFSLTPPVMRSVLPTSPIKKLFSMLLQVEEEGLEDNNLYQIHIQEDEDYFYVLLITKDGSFKKTLLPILEDFKYDLVTTFVQQTDHCCYGVIFRDPVRETTRRLRHAIEQAMTTWAEYSAAVV